MGGAREGWVSGVLSPSFFISLFFGLFPLTFWGAKNAKQNAGLPAGRLRRAGGAGGRYTRVSVQLPIESS